MRYGEFLDAWRAAAKRSDLSQFGFEEETCEIDKGERRYQMRLEPLGGQQVEPFTVTATLSWRWSALATARSVTKEDDMIVWLFGERGSRRRTEKPWLRVDIALVGATHWGKALPMPSAAAWRRWEKEVSTRLDSIQPLLPRKLTRTRRGNVEVFGWKGVPEATVECHTAGELRLSQVSIEAWQALTLPRTMDDLAKADPSPTRQLDELFGRVRASVYAWMESLDHLAHVVAKPAR